MGLRDDLVMSLPGTVCAVKMLLDELDEATAVELRDLIDDKSVQSTALARLCRLKNWTYVSDHSFARHRRKDCRCH